MGWTEAEIDQWARHERRKERRRWWRSQDGQNAIALVVEGAMAAIWMAVGWFATR